MKHVSCIIFLIAIFFSKLSAQLLPHCNKHSYEIALIRGEAQDAIVRCQRQGGDIFRSFVFTIENYAFDSVRHKSRYSEFSDLFNELVNRSNPPGLSALFLGQDKIANLFFELYSNCIKEHSGVTAAYYERGRIYFDRGLYEECLSDIKPIIDSGKWDITEANNNKEREFLLMQGTSQLEAGTYDSAIDILSELIKKDPNNKEAYYNRALAYFETGYFDLALQDYISSDAGNKLSKIKQKTSNEFSFSLLAGLLEGGREAAIEFVPSLCSTAYGLGECLWSFVEQPKNATTNFCNACYEAGGAIAEYVKSLERENV